MPLCSSGSKKPNPLVSQMFTKADQKFFSLQLFQFSVNVILLYSLYIQDIFHFLPSLVEIQEMILWSMLAIISSPYISGIW